MPLRSGRKVVTFGPANVRHVELNQINVIVSFLFQISRVHRLSSLFRHQPGCSDMVSKTTRQTIVNNLMVPVIAIAWCSNIN